MALETTFGLGPIVPLFRNILPRFKQKPPISFEVVNASDKLGLNKKPPSPSPVIFINSFLLAFKIQPIYFVVSA